MSMPIIPNLNPKIDLDRDQAVNIILTSIGMEELSLAHLMNAEAEKIQFALGTLNTANNTPASMKVINETNKLAEKTLRDVIKNQMLLGMKMEDTLDLTQVMTTTTTTTTTTTEAPTT